jgi:hypothetical protein
MPTGATLSPETSTGPGLGGAPATSPTPGVPGAATSIGLNRPQPFGSGKPPEMGTPGGLGGAPGEGPALPPSPDGPVVSLHRPVARPAQEASSGIQLPPSLPSFGTPGQPGENAGQPGPTASTSTPAAGQPQGTGQGATGSASGGGTPAEGPPEKWQPRTGQGILNGSPEANPEERRRPVALRPARIEGNEEAMLYVECRADQVVFYPSRKVVTFDELTNTPPYNPLTQAVHQLILRQMNLRQPNGPAPRFHIRFLVQPEGLRTFHRAYPALDTISVPKSRYNLMPDDDVARIVTGN